MPALLTPPSQKVHFCDLLAQSVFTKVINCITILAPLHQPIPLVRKEGKLKLKDFNWQGPGRIPSLPLPSAFGTSHPPQGEVVPHSPGLSELSEEQDLLSCLGFNTGALKTLPLTF